MPFKCVSSVVDFLHTVPCPPPDVDPWEALMYIRQFNFSLQDEKNITDLCCLPRYSTSTDTPSSTKPTPSDSLTCGVLCTVMIIIGVIIIALAIYVVRIYLRKRRKKNPTDEGDCATQWRVSNQKKMHNVSISLLNKQKKNCVKSDESSVDLLVTEKQDTLQRLLAQRLSV